MDPDLDPSKANVTGVSFEQTNGSYRFWITVTCDPKECRPDWWQAETPNGEPLARRELPDRPRTLEMTRSSDVDVPDGVTTVVIRAHVEGCEDGGQSAVVNLVSGHVEYVRNGPGTSGLQVT